MKNGLDTQKQSTNFVSKHPVTIVIVERPLNYCSFEKRKSAITFKISKVGKKDRRTHFLIQLFMRPLKKTLQVTIKYFKNFSC